MPGVQRSPVLVGRDDVLARARGRLTEATGGRGGVLFAAGEAGIGKSRLLAEVTEAARESRVAVLRATAFPGDADASGGLLVDLGADARAAPATAAAGASLTARLQNEPGPGRGSGDMHRMRRLLVAELTDLVASVGDTGPHLVVLEDLHWADELSLEVVARLAARVTDRRLLVLGAYRTDELFPMTPMRRWRAHLLARRLAEEVRLPRLTREQTEALTTTVLGAPASRRLVDAVHERSDGIPLHVEELLAAGDALPRGGTELAPEVPDTLAEAVMLRVDGLDPPVRGLADAAAVVGRSFDFDLLTAVTDRDPAEVDAGLRELQGSQLVSGAADGRRFDFRHALIRDAIYQRVPVPLRRRLHGRVADTAAARGYPHAFVSAHYEQAEHPPAAHRFAVLGAREAVAMSSHREGVALYRRALRTLSPDAPPAERAALLQAVGIEAAAVDENAEAVDALAAAEALWARAGEAVASAEVVPALVAATHLLGQDLAARAARLHEALARIAREPDTDRVRHVRAQLYGALAAAYMLDRRLDESIAFGERSRALSEGHPDGEVALNTTASLGAVLVFAGRGQQGWPLLEDAVGRSVARHREAEAARAYRMIGTSASVLVEYDRAERWLGEGIAYADAVDLWNHRSYMAAHLAHVQWATGDWVAAERLTRATLADGSGGITTSITARYVLGYLYLGRGAAEARDVLEAALAHAETMSELQRISPPLWGLAETALLAGDAAAAVERCERGLELSLEVADTAYLFPFLVTGTRAYLAAGERDGAGDWVARACAALDRRSIPGTAPARPHARGLLALADGDLATAGAELAAARDGWSARRRFWEGTWARLDLARHAYRAGGRRPAVPLAREVRALAEAVGAVPLLRAADELLTTGRGRSAQQPWNPLTRREFAVAELVAEGLTTKEIAARLVLSPRTVDSHVEHILAKLGASRRTEVAAWAAQVAAQLADD